MGNFDDLIAEAQKKNAPQQQMQPQEQVPAGAGTFGDLIAEAQGGKEDSKQSAFMDAVDSFNGKVREFANGELQLFAKGLGMLGIDTSNFQEKLAQDTSKFVDAANKASTNSPYAAAAGNMLGSVVNTGVAASQMGGYGVVSPAKSIMGRAAQQGLIGAAEGAAEYGTAEERAQKGLLTGAISAGTSGIIDSVGKGVKALRSGNKIDPSLGPQTLGQVTGNESIQNIETGLSKIPLVGTKSNIKEAAKNIDDKTIDFLSKQGIDVTGKSGARMGKLATDLKEELYTAATSARSKASAEYLKAFQIADEENVIIPLTNAGKIADEALNPKLVQEGFKSADVSNTAEGKLLQELSKVRKISGSGFELLRQKIGEVIGSTNDTGMKRIFSQIKSSMDTDLTDAAKLYGGNFETQITKARQVYQDLVGPFKSNKVLKSAGKFGSNIDSDDLLKKALGNDHPELSKTLMSNLTPKGQETYTQALLLKAVNKSFDKNSRHFDVRSFNDQLYKMGETLDALPEATKTTIKGLQKFISGGDHILKAAKNSNNALNLGAVGGLSAAAYALRGWGPLMAAGGAAKIIGATLTNPTIVKQLGRLGGGNLSKKTSNNTIKYILRQIMTPAVSSSITDGMEEY